VLVIYMQLSETPKLGFTGVVNANLLIHIRQKCPKYCLNKIQDFTIRAPILNFVGGMARNKRFSGESGREPRRIFKDNVKHQPTQKAPLLSSLCFSRRLMRMLGLVLDYSGTRKITCL
jgi:hypothetical protein